MAPHNHPGQLQQLSAMLTPRSRPDGTRPDYAQLNCPVLPTRDSVGQFQLDGSLVCISTHLQLGDGAPQPPWPATTAERNAHASQPAGWHASGLRPAQLPCAAYPRFRGQFQLDGSLVRISMHLQLGDGAPQPPQFAIAIEHHQQWARI